MSRSRLMMIAVFGLLLWPAGRAFAGDAASDRAEFDQTYSHFKDLLNQCAKLQDSFAAADPAQRAALQQQFNALVKEGNAMRPKLKTEAEKVYIADPKDKDIANLMYAMVIGSMRADEYEEVLRVGKLLIEHNYPRDELYNLAGTAAFFVNDFDDAEKYLKTSEANHSIDQRGMNLLQDIPEYRGKWAREQKFRAAEAKADDLPRVRLTIADHAGHVKGDIVVELFENEAPNTVANFISLVNKQFYDGLNFHRVLPGFMAQGGDPKGDGSGGPGYHIADECFRPDHREHFRGSLSMAHAAEKNTGGSQFFINFTPTAHLDGIHTVFGRVIEGMDVLTQIQRIDPDHPSPIQPDKILKAEVIRKRPHIYSPEKLP
ncbi:MAG TPA: peptidylprolyl isomerase [Pirellulales bacterium]|jgi:cyclophilin family peptidyl-prolyl cis-trans isomerase|nr:peptidylprolyl isomerase [Pirellulales bacterium]